MKPKKNKAELYDNISQKILSIYGTEDQIEYAKKESGLPFTGNGEYK